MRKKSVWLRILIVLSILIAIVPAFVSAEDYVASCTSYPYTLKRTTNVGSPEATYNNDPIYDVVYPLSILFQPGVYGTLLPLWSAGFNSSLLDFETLFKQTSLPICSRNPYGFSYDREWNQYANPGFFAGGYLYTTEDINNVAVGLDVHTGTVINCDFNARGVVFIYDLYHNTTNTYNFINKSNLVFFYGNWTWDDGDRASNDIEANARYLFVKPTGYSMEGAIIPPLKPMHAGLYYITSGIAGGWECNPRDNDAGIRLTIYPNSTILSNAYDASSVDANGRGFVISNNILTTQQINDKFKEQVEQQQWLCKMTGGDFDPSLGCCGNNGSLDLGINVTDENGENSSCIWYNNSYMWVSTGLKAACEDLSPNAAYRQIHTNIQTAVDISTVINGRDNCCGDDEYYWGFEGSKALDEENWACVGDCLQTVYPDFAHQGSSSLAFSVGDTISTVSATHPVTSVIGSGYVWVYIAGTGSARLTLNTGSSPVGSSTSASRRWTRLSVNSASSINNLTLSYTGTGNVYFDDAFIERNPYLSPTKFNDYGFITNISASGVAKYQYMCYYNLLSDSSLVYNWSNAMMNSYHIASINTPNGVVDAVSNGDDWYYCNADGRNSLSAKAVGEGKTFGNRYVDGTYPCIDILKAAIVGSTFVDGCTYTNFRANNDCCNMNGTLSYTGRLPGDCANYCRRAGDSAEAVISPDSYAGFNTNIITPTTNTVGESDDINVDPCRAIPSLCTGGSLNLNNQLSCLSQPTNLNKELCDRDTQFCRNGIYVSTIETGGVPYTSCCIGNGSSCVNRTVVTSAASCQAAGGQRYTRDPKIQCVGTSIDLDATSACCIGNLLTSDYYASLDATTNSSFICFKEEENNIFSQCCYDKSCKNLGNTPDYISLLKRRVLSKGASIHTIQNFDYVDSATGGIANNGRKLLFETTGGSAFISFTPAIHLNTLPSFAGFQYLEFDMVTNARNMTFSIGGNYLGQLTDYSTNGGNTNVWHHIVVPLSRINYAHFDSIVFATSYVGSGMTIDNIVLTPPTGDYSINTKPYYCTGGFQGWVDDLDAPIGTTNYSIYGPYMFACNGLISYGWTGSQCCGDDTKGSGINERFNDSLAGCFDGSVINNDQAVWASKGYFNSSNPNTDEVKNYPFNYLLYYNDSFVGCQMPNRASSLVLNYNGTAIGSNLVRSNIDTQCTTVGSYYCMDGVWRQGIKTSEGHDRTFSSQIQLKAAPGGAELLKNTFGGT